MAIRKLLAKNVRRLAAKRGLSIERLAYECGVSKGFAYEVARGTANPSIAILERLAKGLRVKPKDLFS